METNANIQGTEGGRVTVVLPKRGEVWTYFAHAGDAIKIGLSVDPRARITSLQTSSPQKITLIACLPAGFITEGEAHRKFAHLHIRGEWFRDCEEIREYLERAKVDSMVQRRLHSMRIRAGANLAITARATIIKGCLSRQDAPEEWPGQRLHRNLVLARATRELEALRAGKSIVS